MMYSAQRPTFDINEAVEETDGLQGEEVSQVFQAHFERVSVVELEVGVHRQAQILLDLLAELVKQVLTRRKTEKK